jgi:hypothetical protein
MGTVFYDLDVPDFTRQRFSMSGLLLSAPSAQQTFTVQPDPVAAKLLSGPATSARMFSTSDVVSLYAEVYENASSGPPRRIDVTTRLIDEAGRDVVTARELLERGSSDARDKSATFPVRRDIPLKDVTPGRYLLRVDAQVRGETGANGTVTRETALTVRGQ